MATKHKPHTPREQNQKAPSPKSIEIVGTIRINPKNYNDAFITYPGGGSDIWIDGVNTRKGALNGDLVRVRLNHCSDWKINHRIIADKWDEWSPSLWPIIEAIKSEQVVPLQISSIAHDANSKGTAKNSKGRKVGRSAEATNQQHSSAQLSKESSRPNNDKFIRSSLPSNLPEGILKLKVEHVISLPFSASCLRQTGTVIDIVKRNHRGVAGGFLKPYSDRLALFHPTDRRVPRILIDLNECPKDFATQHKRYKDILFVAIIAEWNGFQAYARGSLVRSLGDSNQIHSRMEALLIEHEIFDEEFPPEVYNELRYLNCLPQDWLTNQIKGRRDLTRECVFTIDPKTARDLDDAVSIRRIAEQIYEVGVHIADVSYFVKEMSAVDHHARLRTTSVYLVDRVIPMLPRVLCEQMCSLNPGEPKLTFSVIWKMNQYGQIIDQWFGRTIIRSCVKLSYEQAQDMIDQPNDIDWIKENSNMPQLYDFNWKRISKSVVLLDKIAKNLRHKRFKDGALRIDQVKMKFELDSESGQPIGFSFEQRSAANYLIEEYMLLANMAVAKRIYQYSREHAFLRRHPSSHATILGEVKDFCDVKGCELDISSAGSIQRSLNKINDPLMSKVISFLLLRSMRNAEYVCAGAFPETGSDEKLFHHFALNVPFYTHFTSPIRRYADIIVHRLLAMSLKYSDVWYEDVNTETNIAEECTKRKVSSKIISDTSQKWYFNLYVKKAGHCELLACVTRIHDQAFDVILIDYDIQGRVYLSKTEIENLKFESFAGVKRIKIDWKQPVANKKKDAATSMKKKNKKKNKSNGTERGFEGQMNDSRSYLESNSTFSNFKMRVNKATNYRQIIEVFDVVEVIVTVDNKDITQVKIDLKPPYEMDHFLSPMSVSNQHELKPCNPITN